MFCEKCNLDKTGVTHIQQTGDITVVVNKALHKLGKAQKFAVAHTQSTGIDSVHPSLDRAVSRAKELHINH